MATGFNLQDGELFVDDISCANIASQLETPFYVYSGRKITQQFRNLNDALARNWKGAGGQPLIAFACKANSSKAIMNLLGGLGAGADVVSEGEIRRAIAAGIPSSQIVFSGVGKTRSELEEALLLGVHQINVETAGELDTLIELCSEKDLRAPVAFRYTPDVETDTHAKISTGEEGHKFGLLAEEILSLYAKATASGVIDAKGLSVHIGSQLFELAAFEQAFTAVADLIGALRERGLSVTVADVGGGLGIPYRSEQAEFDVDAYAALINRIFAPLNVRVMLEPGRYLVAEAGALITKVIYLKDRPEKRFVIVDAGMNDLIRPTLYEAYHPVVPLTPPADPTLITCDIVGPVCETGDYLALERPLPSVQPDDLLAILCAGAYGSVMSSQYNSRPFIAEALVNGNLWATIRERQSVEAIWAHESIPDWLK